MNSAVYLQSELKNKILTGAFSFGDSFKMLLMRDDFRFSPSQHTILKNIKTASASVNMVITASAKTIVRSTGNFITDGFVAGNLITTNNASNTGNYRIDSISQTTNPGDTLRISLIDGDPISDVLTPTAMIITSDDEHKTANGYTQGGIPVEFTIDGNNVIMEPFDWSDLGIGGGHTATGGVIYDDTNGDDIIVGYLKFSTLNFLSL